MPAHVGAVGQAATERAFEKADGRTRPMHELDDADDDDFVHFLYFIDVVLMMMMISGWAGRVRVVLMLKSKV